jgi:MFS family permease
LVGRDRRSGADLALLGARSSLVAFFLTSGLTLASFLSRVPDVQTRLGLSPSALGMLLLALSVGVVTGLLLAGRVVLRVGSRAVLRAGVIAATVALPLTGLAGRPATVALCLALLGYGLASMDVGMNAQGIGLERTSGRSLLVGMHAAWSLGTLLGALGGSIAIATGTPMWTHLAILAGFVVAVASTAGRHLTIDDAGVATTPPGLALPRGPLLPLALLAFASVLGESTAGNWAGIHLRDTVEVAPGRVGWAFVAHTTGMVVSRLVGDRLAGRFGRQRLVRTSGVLAGCGFLVVAGVPTLVGGVVGFLLVGLGLGPLVPLAFSTAGRLSRSPGEGVAAVHSVGYLAALVSPPAIGALADTIGLSGGFVVVAGVILVLATRPLPIDRQPDPA